MLLRLPIVSQPTQGLALATSDLMLAQKRFDQLHACAQMRQDRNMPALSALALDIGWKVTHIGDHIPWPPGPPALASLQAGRQKLPFGNIGRSHPNDQWHQQYAASILRKPESQAMFFVTDKPRA